jgi:predicted Zn-dependent peptidase
MFKPLACAALLAAVHAPLLAQNAAEPKAPKIRIDYTQETLPNGLTVLYSLDRSTPVVAVEVMYNVGSKHEQIGRTGFAHLFEHVMFKGSKNVADGEHWSLLEKAGGRAGADINGTTWTDRTNYFEQVPSNYLELALWLESDRMGTLTETLTKEKLDNQREVVKNERRQSVDNQPYGSWLEKVFWYGFPDNHPYKHAVIGSMEDLSAASVDDVISFFKTYYAPNNAVLVIAGDFDLAQAKSLVRKHFNDIPRGPAAPALRDMTVPKVIGKTQREVIQDPNAPAPVVYVAFRAPAARGVDGAAVGVLGAALAGNRATPFFKDLVREKQIAVAVNAFNFGLVDGADLLVFQIRGKANSNVDSLEQALIGEISNAANLLTDAGVEQAKASARFDFINGLQTTGGFGGRADALAEGFTYYRDPNHVNTVLDDIDNVTPAKLQALIAERLVPQNRVTLVYVPAKKAATSGDR